MQQINKENYPLLHVLLPETLSSLSEWSIIAFFFFFFSEEGRRHAVRFQCLFLVSSIPTPCKISPPLPPRFVFSLNVLGFVLVFFFLFTVVAISVKWPSSTNCLKKALSLYRSVLRICDEFYHPLNETVLHLCMFPVLVEVLVWNPNRPQWWIQAKYNG